MITVLIQINVCTVVETRWSWNMIFKVCHKGIFHLYIDFFLSVWNISPPLTWNFQVSNAYCMVSVIT